MLLCADGHSMALFLNAWGYHYRQALAAVATSKLYISHTHPTITHDVSEASDASSGSTPVAEMVPHMSTAAFTASPMPAEPAPTQPSFDNRVLLAQQPGTQRAVNPGSSGHAARMRCLQLQVVEREGWGSCLRVGMSLNVALKKEAQVCMWGVRHPAPAPDHTPPLTPPPPCPCPCTHAGVPQAAEQEGIPGAARPASTGAAAQGEYVLGVASA